MPKNARICIADRAVPVLLVLLCLIAMTGCQLFTRKEAVTPGVTATVVEQVSIAAQETLVAPTATPAKRTGAWVDEVIFVEEPNNEAGVDRLAAGELDLYNFPTSDPAILGAIRDNPDLTYFESVGSYAELTFNPAGPVFQGSGRLNPFAISKIREAMNWLVDRNYIIDEFAGGLGSIKLFPIVTVFPDYARYADVARALEAKYAHNTEKAAAVIRAQMEKLGAEWVDGRWQYDGEPVEIKFLIRVEDERREYGDYVSNLLELLGFTVERMYRTAAEASPIWIRGNPQDGEWHIYTGGWITTAISRDQGGSFDFFFTPRGLPFPLWQAYTPSEELAEIADRLKRNDYSTLEERRELFSRAMELALEDSAHIFLYDQTSISPYRAEVEVTGDLAGAIYGARLWPYTLRRAGQVGGALTIGMPSILTEPWNPIAGTKWIYDTSLIQATGDPAALPDPFTGLNLPQRLASGEVYVEQGLPVASTLDWVRLEFVPSNKVPDDAWVDWDAAEQRFLTAAEAYTQTETAKLKVVCNYEDTLYQTAWHDGSPFDLSDIVMAMIMHFDRAKKESAIFDEATVPAFESFIASFKGWRIAAEDPLVVEYYSDEFALDAEAAVSEVACGWPEYGQGYAPWHMVGLGILAETSEKLAFSSAKADLRGVEWMSYIAGPSLEILGDKLAQAATDNYIPYEPTLGATVTPQEARARWANYREWNRTKRHFWLGNGPFYLERAFPREGSVVLKRNPSFIDVADKWAGYETPRIAEVEIEGPDRVNPGDEATYEVTVTFEGAPYPLADLSEVTYLVFDTTGSLVLRGEAEAVDDGLYRVVLSGDQTSRFEAQAHQLEVIVVPGVVSIPTFADLVFVSSGE